MTELEKQQAEIIRRKDQEIDLLKQKIDALVRRHFGAKSEQIDPKQLELLLSGENDVGKPDTSVGAVLAPVDDEQRNTTIRRNKRSSQPRLPEHLPVEERVIEPTVVKACPDAWKRIGEEISEQLDYQPGRFLRLRIIRPKYVRRDWREKDQAPVMASLPARVIEGGLPTSRLLAHVVTGKYLDHLPLYRQQQIYRSRYGMDLSRQTLANWVEQVAVLLQPVARCIHSELLRSDYLQIDETPLAYLEPGRGETARGYLWTCRVPGVAGGTLYQWHLGRAHSCLKSVVPESFNGVIQCDGYRAYETFASKHPGDVVFASCWAHVRRKFHEAFKGGDHPVRSAWILRQIKYLYQIERELRDSRAGPRLRQAIRASQSRPIIRRLHDLLITFQKKRLHLPQSLLGRAISYALGQWSGLLVYLERGVVEIDNNLVENAIRPTKLGAKNWLFIGSQQAGERSAAIYTVLANCRDNGIEPYTYLTEILDRLPAMPQREVKNITPQKIAARNRVKVAS